MARLMCYLTMGLGDWYNLVTQIPEIAKERKIPRENIHVYLDSIYFYKFGHMNERSASMEIIKTITDNLHIIPNDCASFEKIYWENEDTIESGLSYKRIKNDFLFYRKQETKNYMKQQIKDGDIFIYGLMGPYNYEWDFEKKENIPLNYKKTLLKFQIQDFQKDDLSNFINSGEVVLIHVRNKNDYANDMFYDKIITFCKSVGMKCILVGIKNDTFAGVENKVLLKRYETALDLRDVLPFNEIMYLIENTKYMIGSSSMFTFHRMLTNKKTIVGVPEEYGKIESVFGENLDNENYVFFNSSEPFYDKVIEEIKKWKKES